MAKPDRGAKTLGSRDASSIGAAACIQITEGFLNQPIQATRSQIAGDLAIPRRGVKLGIPGAKRLHVAGRQVPNRVLNFLDRAHTDEYTAPAPSPQRPFPRATASRIVRSPRQTVEPPPGAMTHVSSTRTLLRQRFIALWANEKVEQLAANNLTIPQDAIASLLQRLVRHAWSCDAWDDLGSRLWQATSGL